MLSDKEKRKRINTIVRRLANREYSQSNGNPNYSGAWVLVYSTYSLRVPNVSFTDLDDDGVNVFGYRLEWDGEQCECYKVDKRVYLNTVERDENLDMLHNVAVEVVSYLDKCGMSLNSAIQACVISCVMPKGEL